MVQCQLSTLNAWLIFFSWTQCLVVVPPFSRSTSCAYADSHIIRLNVHPSANSCTHLKRHPSVHHYQHWMIYATIGMWLCLMSVWLYRMNEALNKYKPMFIIRTSTQLNLCCWRLPFQYSSHKVHASHTHKLACTHTLPSVVAVQLHSFCDFQWRYILSGIQCVLDHDMGHVRHKHIFSSRKHNRTCADIHAHTHTRTLAQSPVHRFWTGVTLIFVGLYFLTPEVTICLLRHKTHANAPC